MNAPVLVDDVGAVRTITWNDPDRLNGLTGDMVATATDAVERAPGTTRVIVLTGAGRAFSTGARLDGPISGTEPMDLANALTRAIVSAPVPVVAAVNGPAAGLGCSVALAADITIARESAYFLLPFTNIGLMPDGGATAVVAASIGRARASAMALLGERLSASGAAESGLIHRAVPDDDFAAEVEQLVDRLAQGAGAAYRATKTAITAATLGHLDDTLDRERDLQVQLFDTADFAEGTSAFMGKRRPVFEGR
ncbi:enoyl-CoA hydratase-related protein [Aeromicrobium fastidiosum]|uniref:Enoyl-CoA hydratase n=1 Tax=Aeromicrobium fastidiosum TaxID=52699 RepID=A0A641ARV9_9ACTN|nr:enoyl-CoA hydratase-related protein [Aeromicrobium fastidiosum]KAA1380257.1 enoyl-CoA hydratase [Aeromicrobium fastidiosum]MBP2389809.1 enoyl-CoA hydratase [Aeromicrobium fastidiosum]